MTGREALAAAYQRLDRAWDSLATWGAGALTIPGQPIGDGYLLDGVDTLARLREARADVAELRAALRP